MVVWINFKREFNQGEVIKIIVSLLCIIVFYGNACLNDLELNSVRKVLVEFYEPYDEIPNYMKCDMSKTILKKNKFK